MLDASEVQCHSLSIGHGISYAKMVVHHSPAEDNGMRCNAAWKEQGQCHSHADDGHGIEGEGIDS